MVIHWKMNSVQTFFCALSLLITQVQGYYRNGPIHGNNFGVPGQNASYDYVVIGGGTAGLALATRLAEDTSLTVAVIEAGGFYEQDFGNISVVPGLGLIYDNPSPFLSQAFPAVDWGLNTVPQTALKDQVYHYWRGRTLGGRYVYQLSSSFYTY